MIQTSLILTWAVLGTLMVGLVWLTCLWPHEPRHARSPLLTFSLAGVLGLAFMAAVYFLWLMTAATLLSWWFVEIIIFLGSVLLLGHWRKRWFISHAAKELTTQTRYQRWTERIMAGLICVTFGGGCLAMASYYHLAPYGSWDAWAMWLTKARFMAHSEQWQRLFDLTMIHPDYPLYYPASVARLWQLLGSEQLIAAHVFAMLCFGLMLLLSVALLHRGWGMVPAALGLLLMLVPSWTYRWLGSLYAELPLVMFMTCALLFAALAWRCRDEQKRMLLLSGILAGFAAWTKNEGVTFALFLGVCLALTHVLTHRRLKGLPAGVGFYALGLLPGLALVIGQKVCFGGGSYLLESTGTAAWHELIMDPQRHERMVRISVFMFADSQFHWLLAGLLVLTALLGWHRQQWQAGACVLLTGLMQCGAYYVVLLLTPQDLSWQLQTSADRLFLHLWPMLCLGALLLPAWERLIPLAATSATNTTSAAASDNAI